MARAGTTTLTDPLRATPAEPRLDAGRGWAPALAWACVALGAAFQAWHFAGARPLWLDEAAIALNIRHLSYAELLGPLDYNQVAPIGWLLLEKLVHGLPIAPEYSLRLPSLVAGVGALVLFRDLAFRVFSPLGAIGAVVLLAFSPPLVRYAAEVKPYETDLFLGLAVLALGIAVLRRPGLWLPGLGALAVLGLIAIPFSFPVIFVLAGVGGVLLAHRLAAGRRSEAGLLALIGVLWVGLFAALMIGLYMPNTAGAPVRSAEATHFFTAAAYAPIPPTSLKDLIWYVNWGDGLLQFFNTREGRLPVLVMMAAGAVHLWRRSPWFAATICLCFAAGLAGSGLHAYPLYDRLALFLLPMCLLLAAGGLDWIAQSRPAIPPWATMLAVCVAGGAPYLQGNLRSDPPFGIQNIRPVMATLQRDFVPGDVIYVSNHAIPAYLFYRKAYRLAAAPWVAGDEVPQQWPCLLNDLPGLAPSGRTWVLSLAVGATEPPSSVMLQPTLSLHNLAGDARLFSQAQNVWLYALGAHPVANGVRRVRPAPANECASPASVFDPKARIAMRAG